MISTLEAHGTKRLKLKFDILLSIFDFKFKLRRYKWGQKNKERDQKELFEVGGRCLHSSTFQLNVSSFCGSGGAL